MAPATIHTPPVTTRSTRPSHSFTRPTLGRLAERRLRGPAPGRRVRLVNERLVWIDCEMTGLDLGADALIEVAALVTDFDLNVLGAGVDLIVKPPAEALDQMNDFVREMHETSGLLHELDSGISLDEAEEQVLAYVREHCPDGSRPPLAGNTVATDRAFLARDMPN